MIIILATVVISLLSAGVATAQQTPTTFGGAYAGLGARRQALVNDWVGRFKATTGLQLAVEPFYDEVLPLSTKTTFDAVTHALMTTTLTTADGTRMDDALALLERVESVRGELAGAAGDRQFRIYVRLTEGAIDRLERSREFKRGVDNTVFHKGYPINYRAQGGTPSIQISIAPDHRRADVDVDYRSSSFPAALFNGHLTASNSDVRAGDNSDRHTKRWAGLDNWWRGFFGIRLTRASSPSEKPGLFALPKVPRAGKKDIEVMVNDFLTAWLVEGDVIAAMGYVSERSYACLAQDADDPSNFDVGQAPFQVMINLKAAHDSLGPHASLDGVIVGVRLNAPKLKVVTQPNHARFVISSVPDDVAAAFDCQSRLTPGDARTTKATYGNYYGATFFVSGRQDQAVSLLWGREDGYWKIVSWSTGSNEPAATEPPAPPMAPAVRIKADAGLAQASRTFLDTWLVRKDYTAAFNTLSPKSYACYDLERNPDQPAAQSPADAGQKILAGLRRIGEGLGKKRSLEEILSSVEPLHPSVRVMDHRDAQTFSLSSIPNALGDAVECEARARGSKVPDPLPAEYGQAFGMTVRFRTMSGDAPVLRLMWRNEGGTWRITAYGIDTP